MRVCACNGSKVVVAPRPPAVAVGKAFVHDDYEVAAGCAGDPEWVVWVGCVHPGYTRRCESCGSTWTRGQVFGDLAELMDEAEVADLEDLCDWLSEDHELDAWVITDDDGHFEVGFGDRGVTIEFPIPAQELWNTLD